MAGRNIKVGLRPVVLTGAGCALLLVALLPALVLASPAVLPPRPTVLPTSTAAPTPTDTPMTTAVPPPPPTSEPGPASPEPAEPTSEPAPEVLPPTGAAPLSGWWFLVGAGLILSALVLRLAIRWVCRTPR